MLGFIALGNGFQCLRDRKVVFADSRASSYKNVFTFQTVCEMEENFSTERRVHFIPSS